MDLIESIKPRQKLFVMDLVNEAGIDVSDWANSKGGEKRARSNPKYCYAWAFSNSEVIVLNIWHRSLTEESGVVLLRSNLRETSKNSSTKGIWKNRADKFDKLVRIAYQQGQSVRVIINEGYRRDGNLKTEKASKVSLRLLDSMPWSVTFYNDTSGEFILTRGIHRPRLVDQFDINFETDHPPEKYSSTSDVFYRNPEVRRIVLQRANGKCEFCGTDGFKTSSGALFLETHHIIPLSQNGPDTIYNVAAICPNHHREAHYGDGADLIRETLTKLLSKYYNH